MASAPGFCCLSILKEALKVYKASVYPSTPTSPIESLPSPSERRRTASLTERPIDLSPSSPTIVGQDTPKPNQLSTILYLAYGSNLSAETFKGKRGIRPLSALNVVVPELVMTFDLPGLPYIEPCFANSAYRSAGPPSSNPSSSEKSPLLSSSPNDYHKTRWKKGLVGVVYEVTPADYAHIIATEGGGASYQDVLVTCHELPSDIDTVPSYPTTQPFKAHTLYSPISPPDEAPTGGRFSRPDPNYAQPSLRYLDLITTGADEHALPAEYKTYLQGLRPYTITSQRQRVGAWIFSMIWLPFISLVFGLFKMFADDSGRAPKWLVMFAGAIFGGMWRSYDGFFFRIFGDGERTIYGDGDGEEWGEVANDGVAAKGEERKWRGRRVPMGQCKDVDEKRPDIHLVV